MSTKNQTLTTTIIKRTHRVPTEIPVGKTKYPSAEAISRQLDVTLISIGFKASSALLDYIASINPPTAKELSVEVLRASQEIKGDHVEHNVYFKSFPDNVPDTIEFWTGLIRDTYGDGVSPLFVNLLALDGYGSYQHSYEEMLAAHEEFIETGKEKLTVLHLGDSVEDEGLKLYTQLAESKVPANEDDRALLERLAELYIDYPQPKTIPVRENKAIINSVRLKFSAPIIVDTVTDVLRVAALISGSDVTLNTKPKFKTMPNKTRKALLQGLEDVVSSNKSKLGDVYKNRESFKRLFLRLNTNFEKGEYDNAYEVLRFAVEGINVSFEAKLEKAFATNDIEVVTDLLSNNPGLFVRSLNRLLLQTKLGEVDAVVKALERVANKVSTPVLLGLRQYLTNRTTQKTVRVFINKKGTGRVIPDEQPVLSAELLKPIVTLIDSEISSRIPAGTYVVSRDILHVALPLSNKLTNDGFGVMPRGSKDSFTGEILRFFTYWKQNKHRTDYDLSAVMLNEDFTINSQLSYTQLEAVGGVHSGDITSAPKGASEFIDLELSKVKAKYIVPQVNLYSGENFNQVKESFFGYMERSVVQKGKPFEAKTVKTKAEMRGDNKVALPLIFIKEEDGWKVKWLNAFLKGQSWGNATENNRLTTSTLVRSIVETEFLTVGYLVGLLAKREDIVLYYEDELAGREDFERLVESPSNSYYIAQEVPVWLEKTDTKTITLKNLPELLP